MNSYSCCKSSFLSDISQTTQLLKLLSDENRLKILGILSRGTHCVCELIDHLELSQSLISHHLKDLKDEGIVSDSKKGLRVYYTLTKKGEKVTDLLLNISRKELFSI